jgi:hypothetical protein
MSPAWARSGPPSEHGAGGGGQALWLWASNKAGVPLRATGLPHPRERRGSAMTARTRLLWSETDSRGHAALAAPQLATPGSTRVCRQRKNRTRQRRVVLRLLRIIQPGSGCLCVSPQTGPPPVPDPLVGPAQLLLHCVSPQTGPPPVPEALPAFGIGFRYRAALRTLACAPGHLLKRRLRPQESANSCLPESFSKQPLCDTISHLRAPAIPALFVPGILRNRLGIGLLFPRFRSNAFGC